jgi:OOP family OmpA-OmpF porin
MMKRMIAVAVVAICGLCLPAWAGDGYVGASYMSSSADFATVLESHSADSDGWKIFGGYNFMKYFGVELTYYDLGSFDVTEGDNPIKADITVFDFSGRGILPLGERFALFAKLGYSTVDVDFTSEGGSSARDWELLYGIGASVSLSKSFGIRAEWESWNVETSLDAWSLGVYFRFGGR